MLTGAKFCARRRNRRGVSSPSGESRPAAGPSSAFETQPSVNRCVQHCAYAGVTRNSRSPRGEAYSGRGLQTIKKAVRRHEGEAFSTADCRLAARAAAAPHPSITAAPSCEAKAAGRAIVCHKRRPPSTRPPNPPRHGRKEKPSRRSSSPTPRFRLMSASRPASIARPSNHPNESFHLRRGRICVRLRRLIHCAPPFFKWQRIAIPDCHLWCDTGFCAPVRP